MSLSRSLIFVAGVGALVASGVLPSLALAGDGTRTSARSQDDDSEGIPLRFGIPEGSGRNGATGAAPRGITGSLGPADGVTGSLGPADGGRHMPEIDPSVVGGAIALVAGGLAILRDRRRRRS